MKTCFSIAKPVTDKDLKEAVDILKSYFPDLPSTLDDLKAIYKKSPRSVIILKDYANNGIVVGAVLILPVTLPFFTDLCAGKATMHNWKNCVDNIISFSSRPVHKVVMDAIVVRKEYRSTDAWIRIMEYVLVLADFLLCAGHPISSVVSESESTDGDKFFGEIMRMHKAFEDNQRAVFCTTMECLRDMIVSCVN